MDPVVIRFNQIEPIDYYDLRASLKERIQITELTNHLQGTVFGRLSELHGARVIDGDFAEREFTKAFRRIDANALEKMGLADQAHKIEFITIVNSLIREKVNQADQPYTFNTLEADALEAIIKAFSTGDQIELATGDRIIYVDEQGIAIEVPHERILEVISNPPEASAPKSSSQMLSKSKDPAEATETHSSKAEERNPVQETLKQLHQEAEKKALSLDKSEQNKRDFERKLHLHL